MAVMVSSCREGRASTLPQESKLKFIRQIKVPPIIILHNYITDITTTSDPLASPTLA